MLQIKNIQKEFRTGELVQRALDGVSLCLRDNEFVSVLGPSGSGKTTLLNIIGGLDRYDSGDLVINGTSTKQYKDRDWDAYRNHSIGFVFQSYNLIPHQSILANVELALTIGGVSRGERRERAAKALAEVGLGEQLHKRPNQLSGGQMQRVAIARALVNGPDILLADEPTGALDSETSIQVMELLKQVAKDRLVVMVTHNPELAERYSTRIVKLRDGRVVDDSAPFQPEGAAQAPEGRPAGKAKMSFSTSLSLSFHNLRTKKGRTVLTAFAGSIGIIGIALILALSSGVDAYIAGIQREAMTSYPITLSGQALDMEAVAGMHGGVRAGREKQEGRTGIFADYRMLEAARAMAGSFKENDLTAFKRYLDDPGSEIHQYLGENGVVYSYGVSFQAYSYGPDGELVASDADTEEVTDPSLSSESVQAMGMPMANMERMGALLNGGSSGAENFVELMPGAGEVVSPILTGSYDVLYGAWPEKYDEVVLVLDEGNAIPVDTLYQLGFVAGSAYRDMTQRVGEGQEVEELGWDYEEVTGHTFYVLPASAHYVEGEDGTFAYMGGDPMQVEGLLEDALELKVTGIIRPKEDAANANLAGTVGYTSLLTDYIIQETSQSPVVLAQERDGAVNVLNGMPFEAVTDEEKAAIAAEYLSGLGVSDKAGFYSLVLYFQAQEGPTGQEAPQAPGQQQAAQGMAPGGQMDEAAMAAMLDQWLAGSPDQDLLLSVYGQYIAGGSYADNMKAFGKASYDAPSSISLYTDSFEGKEAVSACIERYNEGRPQEEQITYTDYVAILTGSITTIVDVISYVLIAFVAVSLVVSSIMIGIITHISVLERTKEIGILRAMGASKRNVSHVFNAETVIIGLFAGVLGVGVTELLAIPINSLLQSLLGAAELSASLPIPAAVLLVLLSVGITVVAGLIPAKSAARKDPVAALRTE